MKQKAYSIMFLFGKNFCILAILAINYVISVKAFHVPIIQLSTNIKRNLHHLNHKCARFHYQSSRRNSSTEVPDFGNDSLSNSPSKAFKSISPETISAIKSYADILTVIESYNIPQFTSDGTRGKCICPFHDDHNPSMQIDKAKGIYKCFSCGAGGDVFNFVREYEHLQGNGEKMSYPASIVKVAKEFVGGSLAEEAESTLFTSKGSNSSLTPEKKRRLEDERKERDRLILVNLAAAEFYASNLITSPRAGGARLHLYTRRITTSLIRTFAIGYAPDAYYHSDKSKWGEGSLVEHLRTKYDFTPQEIVDAGLASVTSAAKTRLQMIQTNNDSEDSIHRLNYSDLMDRFRNRLIIPIFDENGRNVLGFGGRYMDVVSSKKKSSSDTYREAKYLNTAETKVFIKKNVLFNLNNVKQILKKAEEQSGKEADNDKQIMYNKNRPIPSVVIVEGYFDAITLYGAGIMEVVASMGTSLTESQLKSTADALGASGKVYLCLDNDDAGQLAMERICTSPWIWDFIGDRKVDINICKLPPDTKDPSDFIEKNTKSDVNTAGILFRDLVLKTSVSWDEWYISRVISRYDSSDTSSFSVTCDKITTFLSMNPNAADRTRRVYGTAGILASILSKDKKGSDGPLKLQLESDLLNMSSRKAASREALARRIEAKDGAIAVNVKQKIMEISSGEGLDPRHQKIQTESLKHTVRTTISNEIGNLKRTRNQQQTRKQDSKIAFNQLNRGATKKSQPKAPPIVPHFSGFQFSKSDSDWLGVTNEKNHLVIGSPSTKGKKKDLVYFNSNKYLGNEPNLVQIDPEQNFHTERSSMINPLMSPNADRQLVDAEYRLLYVMVHFPSARNAMKSVLLNKKGDGMRLEWSNPEREWLFQCLTDSPGHENIPPELQDDCSTNQLKEHLKMRPDVPMFAFRESHEAKVHENSVMPSTRIIDVDVSSASSPTPEKVSSDLRFESEEVDNISAPETKSSGFQNMNSNQSTDFHTSTVSHGSLDVFFSDHEDFLKLDIKEDSATREERAELTVQESVAFMLRALAMKRLDALKNEWLDVSQARKVRKESEKNNSTKITVNDRYANLDDEKLEDLYSTVGQNYLVESRTVRELTESIKELNRKLVGYCSSDSEEGRNSESVQRELIRALDEYVNNLPPDPRPTKSGSSRDYIFGMDAYNPDIDEMYGGRRREDLRKGGFEEDDSVGMNRSSAYDSIFE